MVVFTCGHCGESVQKPKVEKHYLTKCRNRNPNLSCMDCFKDFLGKEYEEHTKCITEEERYSGKGFVAKEKKGEKKQNVWVEMLQSVLDEHKGAPKNVLRILETIGKHNNTPRKKPKFINFVKNVCGHKTNPKDIDQAWDLISVKLSALSNATQNKNQNQKNDASDDNGDSVGDTDEKSQNSEVVDNEETTKDKSENIPTEVQSDEADVVDEKKLSKKQLKEEKKRKKYEAELQSAVVVAPPVQAEEEEAEGGKKGKKKKNRTDSTNNGDVDIPTGEKNKQKRKRQDTVNGAHETIENGSEPSENVVVPKEKVQKKKRVNDCEELDESICLHDQNVAKIGELAMDSDKFNWHAVILSVLEKKGNEVQFKRLQKKVLGEYAEMTGRDVDDRIADKFIKKLKSAPNVRVDKNRVVLVQ